MENAQERSERLRYTVSVLFTGPSCAPDDYGRYVIESLTLADTLPARSLYCTYTVLVPTPLLRVHPLLVVYGTHGFHFRPSLDRRSCTTRLAGAGSVAFRASLTFRLLVMGAPLFILIVPEGFTVSIVQVYRAGVGSVLPTASVAYTSKRCRPSLSECL